MHRDVSEHEGLFLEYAASFCEHVEKKDMLDLKIVHTMRVLEHMRCLVREEEVLRTHARACLLAALYHDVGRFLQFSTYGTFKDAHSINHAVLGAKILHRQGFLRHESKEVQRQVLIAVSMHNRYKIPHKISLELVRVINAVRDADKLDILRIMAEHFSCKDAQNAAVTFHAKDFPMSYSDNVLQDVLHNRLASYADIVYVNDFKLLLCTWVHDITYKSSLHRLLASQYIEVIMAGLPDIPVMQTVQDHVRKTLSQLTANEANFGMTVKGQLPKLAEENSC